MTKELIWRFGEDWSQREEQRDQVRGKLRCWVQNESEASK